MPASKKNPRNVPRLFYFEWSLSGKYEARLQPELARRYEELTTNSKALDFDLAWALDISSKISKQGIDSWVNGDGALKMSISDEDYLGEYGEPAPKTPNTKRLIYTSNFREGLSTIAKQSCQVVFELQRTLGQDLTQLMESEEKAVKKRQLLCLKKKFAKALSLLSNNTKPHGNSVIVETTFDDGKIERVPLPAKAIIVALKLTNRHQELKLPAKKDVEIALEALYPDLKNYSPNWSSIFKQSGLNKLPDLSPWTASKSEAEKLILMGDPDITAKLGEVIGAIDQDTATVKNVRILHLRKTCKD
ncbi:MAG: hypothetical protein K9N47_13615 [Prosthecobacter sp.]|uniref:hypothetical protein n=1 Tax=Prosthecobacter sp. TaxID=1965333 RepID=UPI0025FA6223|nr:hypothetical protein [Prosthecobacter sp.]MCF7787159.1 hypothetical protein [Prosthecobacter sp.]